MSPQIVFLIFSLIVLVFVLLKPQWARIFVGFFFFLMALGVNLSMLLSDPGPFVQAGAHAFLPVYRWFFTTVLAAALIPLVVALIAFELSVGTLILSRGRWVRYGLMAAVVFCVGLAPLGIESITTPVLGLAIGLLLRKEYPRSLLDMLFRRPLRPVQSDPE